jgi:hypothetical protein
MKDFEEFKKIPRLSRECFVTEKIDGTNGCIYIGEDGEFLVGSRTRWLDEQNDHYGFFRWAMANKDELLRLGKGTHFGEWMGQGIQKNYGLKEKRFYLFNYSRWADDNVRPKCCHVVPLLYQGIFDTEEIEVALYNLQTKGSVVSPGFMKPEGVVIYHVAGNLYFKKTIDKDEEPKGKR